MEILISILFYFFAILAVAGGLFILFTSSIVYAALGLLASLISVAGLFILAGADFLGVTQIMIYIGGILVLFLFGIMMSTKLAGQSALTVKSGRNITAALAAGSFFAVLILIIISVNFENLPWIKSSAHISNSTVSHIGIQLMTSYILPFELGALILMAALIGASFIAAKVIKKN